MKINCDLTSKCTSCNSECDLAFKSPPRLVEVRKRIAIILFELARLAELKESIDLNCGVNYPYYVGVDSYTVQTRFKVLERELANLRFEEKNIVKTLHRKNREGGNL